MNSIRRYIILVAAALVGTGTYAQSISDFYVETRLGHESEWRSGEVLRDATGFKGQWLNLRLDGQINDRISYSYRQRLNKNSSRTFFDATDWLHIDWKATDDLSLSAGKQVVAIGGYEYDRAPIDLYYCSEFWNNIPCYQLGVSAAYSVTPADQILFQVCNTPFREWVGNNKYAYNLMWYGSHGFWETMWSANMIQSAGDHWMNYIALGNRFNFTDWMHLDIDIMNRALMDDFSVFEDFSLMTEFSVSPRKDLRIFAKYTFDVNDTTDDGYDLLVHDGTFLSMISAGAEYTPAEAPNLKLFVAGFHSWGDNTNKNGTRMGEQTCLEMGVKWRLDILKSLK